MIAYIMLCLRFAVFGLLSLSFVKAIERAGALPSFWGALGWIFIAFLSAFLATYVLLVS